MVAGVDRLNGYRAEARESDRRSIVAVGDFTRESGAQAMAHLLDDDPQLDAVFVANDPMAEGALRTLHKAGRRVPDDVAVVGFDDSMNILHHDLGLESGDSAGDVSLERCFDPVAKLGLPTGLRCVDGIGP